MIQEAFAVEHQAMTLRGMAYRPDRPGRHPAVMLLHSFTGTRTEAGYLFVRLARGLAERGVAAVTFDFRHCGESDGCYDQMQVTGELADAEHMTRWLQNQPFVDSERLGLLGFSLGGLVASCLAGRTDVYRALALLAPTTAENVARYDQREHPDEPVYVRQHRLNRRFFEDLSQLDPLADVVRHPRPTLLIQGTQDVHVRPDVSDHFVRVMREAEVELEHRYLEGSDHWVTQ
ncbi:MAG: alpha/beta hydrolase family protein, partial [Phycisphaeraceae bacterium]